MSDSLYAPVRPGPPSPSRILQPSGLLRARGTERYVVEGAGAILITVGAGDRLAIVNDEGGQPCEIVAAGPDGRIDAGILGLAGTSDAGGLKALLTGGDASLARLRAGIARRGIDLAQAGAVRMFGTATPPRQTEALTVQRDGVLVIAAPGAPMAPGRPHAASHPYATSASDLVPARQDSAILPEYWLLCR